MEENAKRALFIGIAIFISIIIISIVVVSISAADKAETIAKKYTGQGIRRDSAAQSLLGKDNLMGDEVIYLLQAAREEKTYSISIYEQKNFPKNLTNVNINNDGVWLKQYDENLVKYIKDTYRYQVYVDYGSNPIKITLMYMK